MVSQTLAPFSSVGVAIPNHLAINRTQPSTLVVRGFANNEIRVTYRSDCLSDKVFTFLPGETSLIKSAEAKRHSQYIDSLSDKRKAEMSSLRAFLAWLSQIEDFPGWHSCPFEIPPKFLAKIFGTTVSYSGGNLESVKLKYLVSSDRTVSVWCEKSQDFPYHFNIEKAQALTQLALDIIAKLQPSKKTALSIGSNHPQRKFTKRARHTLLEAGEIVQQSCPSLTDGAHARAVTLTLPGSSQLAIKNLAAYSSWLLNCLLQEIRKTGEKVYYFGVWELQKRGALHLHLCIAVNPLEQSMEFLKDLGDLLIKRWFQLLKSMASKKEISRGGKTGNLPGVDMFELSASASRRHGGRKSWVDCPEKWQSDNQAINKSVAGYFSKYASKSVNTGNQNNVSKVYCPSRWWFCSKSVREKIKQFRFEYSVPVHLESIELIKEIMRTFPPIQRYQYSFEVKQDDRLICEGHTEVIYWDSSLFKDVHELFKDLKQIFADIGYNRSVKKNRVSTVLYSKKPALFKFRKLFDELLTDIAIYEYNNKYSVFWRKYNQLKQFWSERQLLSEFDCYEEASSFIKQLITDSVFSDTSAKLTFC